MSGKPETFHEYKPGLLTKWFLWSSLAFLVTSL